MRKVLIPLVLTCLLSVTSFAMATNLNLSEPERELAALFVGQWALDVSGTLELMPAEEREIAAMMFEQFTMVLNINQDGTYSVLSSGLGSHEEESGLWQISEVDLGARTLKVTMSGPESTQRTSFVFLNDDRLRLDVEEFSFIMVRQEERTVSADTQVLTPIALVTLSGPERELEALVVGQWAFDAPATLERMSAEEREMAAHFLPLLSVTMSFSEAGTIETRFSLEGERDTQTGNWRTAAVDLGTRSLRIVLTIQGEEDETASLAFLSDDQLVISYASEETGFVMVRQEASTVSADMSAESPDVVVPTAEPMIIGSERELEALLIGQWAFDVASSLELMSGAEREMASGILSLLSLTMSFSPDGTIENRFSFDGQADTETGTWQTTSVDLGAQTVITHMQIPDKDDQTMVLRFLSEDRLVLGFGVDEPGMVMVRQGAQTATADSPAESPEVAVPTREPEADLDQSLIGQLVGNWSMDYQATVGQWALDGGEPWAVDEMLEFFVEFTFNLGFSADGNLSWEMAEELETGVWQAISTDSTSRQVRVLLTPGEAQQDLFVLTFITDELIKVHPEGEADYLVLRRQ